MKKFLLCAAALVVAMSVNAQEKFQMNGEGFGLTTSYSACPAGKVWYEGQNITVTNAFTTDHKIVDCKNHDYNKLTIDGQEFVTSGGVQGNDNPKDKNGIGVAMSLLPPTSGAVININALNDGWVYIVAKLSSNKSYMVFEEGTAIGYKIAMEIEDSRFPNNVLNLEVKGEGEYNQLPMSLVEYNPETGEPLATGGVQWVVREFLNDKEAASANNGLGVFYFPVVAGLQYYASASGSKISWCGILFQPEEATSIQVEGVGDPAKAPMELLGSTGIKGLVADQANANAPIYNLAGQKVNANYKGVVIQNGKKFIQ